MHKPKVSIIIPAYNASRYIQEAVDSALDQDYENLEVMVVDDGSTDKTRQILENYIGGGKIKYFFEEENKGLAAVRNRGITFSSGELVAFLDADDIFFREKISEQVKVFLEDPGMGLSYSGLIHFTDETNKKFFIHRYNDYRPRDVFLDLLKKQFINPSTVMIRKSLLNKYGLFDESLRFSEDWDLWLRLSYNRVKFCYLDKLLTYYRIRKTDNLSSLSNEPMMKENNLVLFKNFFSKTLFESKNKQLTTKILYNLENKAGVAYLLVNNKERALEHIGKARGYHIYPGNYLLNFTVWLIPAPILQLISIMVFKLKHRLLLRRYKKNINMKVKKINNKNSVKLHLGCQEKYLKGYINIDLPPEKHSVQEVKADKYADVRELVYEEASVDEIRSHHLLEHFSRQEALVLLSRWHKWLKIGGVLVVETPDFEESAEKFVSSSLDDQFVLARHIFGSHEASWAYHKDFWSEQKFRYVLESLGFGKFRFEKFSNNLEQKIPMLKNTPIARQEGLLGRISKFGFNNLPNIICYAEKVRRDIDYKAVIRKILYKSLVGREKKILDVWMKEVDKLT